VDKHGERLERDLLLFYRIELIDVLELEHSPRKILNLISRLPEESHLRSVESWGEKWEGWTLEHHLAALILEQQIYSRHDFAQANSTKKVRGFPGLGLPGKKNTATNNPFQRMLAEAKAYEARQARANGESERG